MKNLAHELEVLTPPHGRRAKTRSVRSLRLYRSVRSFIPKFVVLALFVFAVFGIDNLLFSTGFLKREGFMLLFVRALSIVPAAYLLNIIRIYFNELYVFKAHVICHHNGRLSLNYQMPVVYYSDVREIVVKQGMLGRILNYGDVFVGTAATKGLEVHLKGIYNPRVIEKFIERMRALRSVHDVMASEVEKEVASA